MKYCRDNDNENTVEIHSKSNYEEGKAIAEVINIKNGKIKWRSMENPKKTICDTNSSIQQPIVLNE